MDRNCDKCIHHTSGMCSAWDCKMQTVEDVKKEAREKAIEEFAEAMKKKTEDYKFADFLESSWSHTWAILHFENIVNEIAEQLKGE